MRSAAGGFETEPPGAVLRPVGHDIGRIHLHAAAAGAKAIPAETRAALEHSFGTDLRDVRVRDDGAARKTANDLNATAFAQGGHIHWGGSAPPLESRHAVPLLAHEIAHVVQQRQASSVEDRVSSAGETAEIAAQAAAREALAGRSARVGGGYAVAATQRQPKNEVPAESSDQDIEIEIITAYLQRVAAANPHQNLKILKVVRDALEMLLPAPEVDKLLDAAAMPSDPAALAKRFAAISPPVSKAALDRLTKFRTTDDPKGTIGRVGDAMDKSKPGSGNVTPVPGDVSPQDKADDLNRRMGGPPTHSGGFDIRRGLSIWDRLWGASKQKSTTPAAAPDLDQAVVAAIDAVAKDALLPSEAKAKGENADNWIDDANAFAGELAQRMGVAQKRRSEEMDVALPAAYARVKDRAPTMTALKDIVYKLRDARPDHASNVRRLIVRVGASKQVWLVIPL